MEFQIHDYYQFDKLRFFEFLQKETVNSTDKAKDNMWNDHWQQHKNTIPYILEYTERFNEPKGQFHILTLDDEVIGCGGVYISDFDKNISLCGTRLWLSKKYRNRYVMREILFPEHKRWSIGRKCKIAALCFNEYNKSYVKIFTRRRLGEVQDIITTRLPNHLFYNGVNEVDFPVKIQYTKQWVIYERLDPNFDFDWNSIRYL